MTDRDWDFIEGFTLGMISAQQKQAKSQKKHVSRKEARETKIAAQQLQRRVQNMMHTTQEDYRRWDREADEKWCAIHNAIPLEEAKKIVRDILDHYRETLNFLVGSDDRESEEYQKAVQPYLAMDSQEFWEAYSMKKYGKHLYPDRDVLDKDYKQYVQDYINECLSR